MFYFGGGIKYIHIPPHCQQVLINVLNVTRNLIMYRERLEDVAAVALLFVTFYVLWWMAAVADAHVMASASM